MFSVDRLNQLVEIEGIYSAIQYGINNYLTSPQKPAKPQMPIGTPTSTQAREYADKLEEWEAAIPIWKEARENCIDYNRDIDGHIEYAIKTYAGLQNIPQQYRDKVWQKAWEDGHGYGFGEVYNKLCSLLEIFE